MSSPTDPIFFDYVSPNDPLGKSGKYRFCRFVIEADEGLRPVFWLRIATDRSIFCGLCKNDIIAKELTTHEMVTGKEPRLVYCTSLETAPEERRRNPHASLHTADAKHPMPRIQLRADNEEPLRREYYFDWYPVTRAFTWVYAFTGSLRKFPIIKRAHERDALIPLRGITLYGVRIAVSIFPIGDGTHPMPDTLSVISVGHDFRVQTSFYGDATPRTGLAFVETHLRKNQPPFAS